MKHFHFALIGVAEFNLQEKLNAKGEEGFAIVGIDEETIYMQCECDFEECSE